MSTPRVAAFDISYEVMDQRLKDIDDGYDLPGIHPDSHAGDERVWRIAAQRKLAENAETVVDRLTWNDLLCADWYLIRAAETDKDRRARLLEMAATIVANIDDIDRRSYDREPRVPVPTSTEAAGWSGFLDCWVDKVSAQVHPVPHFIPLREIELVNA